MILSIDVETTNDSERFTPFSEDRLLTIAAFDGTNKYFWNLGHPAKEPDNLDKLFELLSDKETELVSHNHKFDRLWLEVFLSKYDTFFERIQCKPRCTMIAADLLQLVNRDKGEKNNLEFLTTKLTKRPKWKGNVKINKLAEESFENLKDYNLKDAVNGWHVYKKIKGLLQLPKYKKEVTLFYFEMENLLVLLEMEKIGVLVDKVQLYKAGRVTFRNLQALQKKVDKLAGQHVYIESNKELPRVLFEDLKMPVLTTTKTGAPATNKAAIDELRYHIKSNEQLSNNGWLETIEAIDAYKKENILWNTFISKIPDYAAYDGRIHAKFNLGKGVSVDPKEEFGAKTGRLSSSDPNLQNQPAKNLIRNILIADENSILVEADYSQIELRIAAFLANEENMIKAFLEGKDLHTFTLANAEGMEYEECIEILSTPTHKYYLVFKNKRWMIKRVSFGVLYGIGIDKLRRTFRLVDIDYSFGQTKTFIEQWFSFFPAMRKYIDNTQKEARKYGFVTTPTGRRIMTPFAKEGIDHAMIARNYRQAVNGKIQSFAADVCKVAMLLTSKKFPTILRTQVHDSLLSEVKRKNTYGDLIDIKPELKKIMTVDTKKFLKDIFNVNFTVPLEVDFKQGRAWKV